MEPRDKLREVVAKILDVSPAALTADSPLQSRRLQGSIGSGILRAAVKRYLGMDRPRAAGCRTYGELEAAVFGDPMPAPGTPVTPGLPAAPAAPAAPTLPVVPAPSTNGFVLGGLSCGVDIEAIDHLPVVADYWESEFYRLHFTDAEIAYCVAQADPRASFAGRWCAKEAVRKCRSDWTALEMRQIEVALDQGGAPRAQLRAEDGATPLPAQISISHADRFAVAIAVLARAPAHAAAHPTEAPAPDAPKPSFWARLFRLPGPAAGHGA